MKNIVRVDLAEDEEEGRLLIVKMPQSWHFFDEQPTWTCGETFQGLFFTSSMIKESYVEAYQEILKILLFGS